MSPKALEHLLNIGRVGAGMYPTEVQAVVEYVDFLTARNAELVEALEKIREGCADEVGFYHIPKCVLEAARAALDKEGK